MARMSPAPRYALAPAAPSVQAVTFKLPHYTLYRLAQAAKKSGRSCTALIVEFVEAGLAEVSS